MSTDTDSPMNATDPETARRIQSLLKATTEIVDRVPIADGPLDNIRNELRALCLRVAADIVEAEAAENGPASDPSTRAATAMVTVAEAVALETVKLQRQLWDEAARRGVSTSAVARARGVTQQAQQALTRRSQQK